MEESGDIQTINIMEKKFVNGLRVYKPREGAPDFIKLNMVINTQELIDWLKVQPDMEIRLDVKESKEKGTLYAEVNNWKATSTPPRAEEPVEKTKAQEEFEKAGQIDYPEEVINPDDIPF